jgi:hypothetical protein
LQSTLVLVIDLLVALAILLLDIQVFDVRQAEQNQFLSVNTYNEFIFLYKEIYFFLFFNDIIAAIFR